MTNKYNFSDDQQLNYSIIVDYFNSVAFLPRAYLLKGVAGSGKTYLATKIITDFKDKNIICSAPTHKAVKVLQCDCDINYRTVQFKTAHSALGLREKVDGYGKVTYEPERNVVPPIEKCKIFILDEASMIDSTLFKRIMDAAYKYKIKVLFIGDPFQIPPVNQLDALPFQEKYQEEFGIKILNLTTIIRQAKGNPIIEKSFEIRNNLKNEDCFLNRDTSTIDENGVIFLDPLSIRELTKQYFATDEFKDNIDHVRLIAWTNKKVNEYNSMIREIIYENSLLPKIVIGEKLIIDAPIVHREKVLLNTNDEVEVLRFNIEKEEVKGLGKPIFLKYYNATVVHDTMFFGNVQNTIKIIHEDSENDFNDILDKLKQLALSQKQGTDQAKMDWIFYYNLRNYFAQIRYAYCLTAHKSQGSTYINSIIDEADILKNPNVIERNRIMYTALTRAKRIAYILTKKV